MRRNTATAAILLPVPTFANSNPASYCTKNRWAASKWLHTPRTHLSCRVCVSSLSSLQCLRPFYRTPKPCLHTDSPPSHSMKKSCSFQHNIMEHCHRMYMVVRSKNHNGAPCLVLQCARSPTCQMQSTVPKPFPTLRLRHHAMRSLFSGLTPSLVSCPTHNPTTPTLSYGSSRRRLRPPMRLPPRSTTSDPSAAQLLYLDNAFHYATPGPSHPASTRAQSFRLSPPLN